LKRPAIDEESPLKQAKNEELSRLTPAFGTGWNSSPLVYYKP
jgi:hypothetical protein